jgi:hypothetical protein
MGESFGYTNVEDLPTNLTDKEKLKLTIKGLEDAVSALQERVAALEFIARRDHPDLVQDWDDDPPEVDA